MKNKTFLIGFLLIVLIAVTSCSTSRSGYSGGSHRKGYGCPTSAGY